MRKEDFFYWDDDDLEAILGEDYTEYKDDNCESDFEDLVLDEKTGSQNTSQKENKNKKRKVAKEMSHYQCPLCPKTYKSISGFRGHTAKQYHRHDLKGLFKLEISVVALCTAVKYLSCFLK